VKKYQSRKPLPTPSGYPFVLYNSDSVLVLGISEHHVRQRTSARKVQPVHVLDLIKKNGHKKTNALLSEFGTAWMTKEGKVFFRSLACDAMGSPSKRSSAKAAAATN
jgi:hypothetical protein